MSYFTGKRCSGGLNYYYYLRSIPLLLLVLVLGGARGQDMGDYDAQLNNSALMPLLTELVYSRISNITVQLADEITNRSSFCVLDPSDDWNRAFNFSSNLTFLSSCLQKTNGDVARRLCTAAELKFYFSYLFDNPVSTNYLKPNKNCNLSTWISGCEPGWACSIPPTQNVDLKEATNIPERADVCASCCEGFFCPHGLTCMIPCPLGSYCPQARLNATTGVCEPYTYQLPPGHPNHSCGGANIWADVGRSRDMFCSAGSYCPSSAGKVDCDRGQYCRMGSISEKPCFKLVSCDASSSNPNLQALGIMLIAAMATLLLIIYNCSDQLLMIRARRLAKSREAAARSARETARARQRWKSAKDAAKRHALEMQAHLSGTFSRRRHLRNNIIEETHILDDVGVGSSDFAHHPPVADNHPPSNPAAPSSSNVKKKQINSRTQIFKYAYAQLEKEKEKELETDYDKSLTFSGVISMATTDQQQDEIAKKKRPLIEVSFKDLTLTLKGKNKHLLRCVTGKLKAGRITAVMGPSGAGKTSFLSALAGKAVGCSMTGLILVNGKKESIHSYKRITGFVPQDDIVHGNLTVEENLWFSAKCRLPAIMLKADKVLVVERVIESLGLQSVRDSLVGTVEKRGISGGQRKRVNVGLEMVIEPSLLILDEPTSGLDSASSLLLMRALRHEALEGVNICMVVHQPSYTLFKMFNDLVMLAKGGLIVYHGPVKKVEEYFVGIGIKVPDRVNPPDHLIDILEGIVVPTSSSTSSAVHLRELPVRWMIYNGYPVPPEMRDVAGSILLSSSSNPNVDVAIGINAAASNLGGGIEEQSFAGELWQDMRSNMERQRDKIRLNFLKSKDLSHRQTPGVFTQYRYFVGRVGKQRLREAKVQAVDYLILLLAGACLGNLAKAGDESFGALGYTYTIIAVSLLSKIAALRSLSVDKLQHWRESASGMSTLAYFLAKDSIDQFNTLIKPLVYLSMFYFFTNPRSSFLDNYIVLLCLVYCVTGIGYALAVFFEQGAAQLWSVLLPVIMTLIATRPKDNGVMKIISNFCYPKWALQAFVISNAKKYYGVWLITRCGALMKNGYDIRDWNICLIILVFIGVLCRAMAYFGMLIFQKR